MRKVISLILAAVICMGLAVNAFAAENPFTPSVSYKDGPTLEGADVHGECLIVTSILQAENKTTGIHQDERDLLLEVYEALSAGTMKVPMPEGYVIRDLVDVNWHRVDCVDIQHGHKEWLAEDNTQITVTFDMGVAPGVKVLVYSFHNGAWDPVKSVTNNGDGTVTVVFEHLCPVAFCVPISDVQDPPETGDAMGESVLLFAGLLAASVMALAVLLVAWRKKRS